MDESTPGDAEISPGAFLRNLAQLLDFVVANQGKMPDGTTFCDDPEQVTVVFGRFEIEIATSLADMRETMPPLQRAIRHVNNLCDSFVADRVEEEQEALDDDVPVDARVVDFEPHLH